MAAMDDPQKVVDAIVWGALHPQEELPVGWKAKGGVHLPPSLPRPHRTHLGQYRPQGADRDSPAGAADKGGLVRASAVRQNSRRRRQKADGAKRCCQGANGAGAGAKARAEQAPSITREVIESAAARNMLFCQLQIVHGAKWMSAQPFHPPI